MEDEYYNFHVNTLLSLKAILFVLMGLKCLTFYDEFSVYIERHLSVAKIVLMHPVLSCTTLADHVK